MAHPDKPEGILYHSRKNPDLRNCAFFERPPSVTLAVAATGVIAGPGLMYDRATDQRLLGHPLFAEALDKYEIALI
jgi:hypothetical protein